MAKSINAQLPFFTCRNIIFDKDIQKDIKRYLYCKDLGINPYKGSYGEQPAKWVDSYFVMRKAFAELENTKIKQSKERSK